MDTNQDDLFLLRWPVYLLSIPVFLEMDEHEDYCKWFLIDSQISECERCILEVAY